ncbi:hypothetical protein [Flavobacterium sp.]|uniref:hypothetical protein n=1 Tax=Flavobacterium sp. TaxID=239 RepID=UPI0037513337
MKKNIVILLFAGCSIYANTKNPKNLQIEKKIVVVNRTKCEIACDNIYTYCVNHGFTKEEARSYADAALKECKKLTIE